MGIKVGDKVRVSKDAPEMYFYGCSHDNSVCKVILVDRDNAVITQVKNGSFAIPTKYLIKVDAEAKEPKFKEGDVVRMKDGYYKEELCGCIGVIRKIDGCLIYVEIDSTIYPATTHSIEPYTEPTAPTIKVGDIIDTPKGKGKVTMVADGYVLAQGDNGEWWQMITIPIDKDKEFEDNIRKVLNGTDEFPMGGHISTSIIQTGEMDWDAYAADLAKEIAVKVANKYNDPIGAAEYAVSVAKAVVENLKKK